eukprot:s737_g25.t1
MGERVTLAARLSCSCTLCLTWRRLGEEIHLGHEHQAFPDQALSQLRQAFNNLLDVREEHRLALWGPLAEGTPLEAAEAEKQPETPERGEKGKDRPSEKRPKEKTKDRKHRDAASPTRGETKEKDRSKKSRSRKKKSSPAKKTSERKKSRSPSKPSGPSSALGRPRVASAHHPSSRQVKEEPSERETGREPLETAGRKESPVPDRPERAARPGPSRAETSRSTSARERDLSSCERKSTGEESGEEERRPRMREL